MKILVVDDNKVNVHLLVSMLGRNNYDVLQAQSGVDAIKIFEQEYPDMVLMDIMMPGMDGRECATELKKLAGDIYIPIIYVTALSQEAALSTALAAGGDDFVSKPINMDILLSKIKAHGRIKQLNSEIAQKNHELAGYNRSLERDQELATHYFDKALQQSYLDPAFIRHHLTSASAFNGDLLMSAPRPGGGIYVILGDFTGHGLGSSIGSLPVAQIFFNLTRQGAWIGDIARELNRELRSLLPDHMFLAATLAELNSTGERLLVWTGGLPDAYLIDSQNHTNRRIESHHPPLGILDDQSFNPSTEYYNVRQQERLYLYTDGIIETQNSEGEVYGSERLHKLFLQYETNVFDRVIDSIHQFTGIKSQTDDTSFVELICQPIADRYTEHTGDDTKEINETLLPFILTFEFHDDELKNESDLVSHMTEMLCASGLMTHKGIIYTILSEIYTNMLDHGLLNLSSELKHDVEGFGAYYERRKQALLKAQGLMMRFEISHLSDQGQHRLVISASHNAKHAHLTTTSTDTDYRERSHGRGMMLLKQLCENIVLDEDGGRVTATYLI